MWPNRDDLMLCPYNRSHVVSKLRIQKHLMKCKKSYPNVKLATCFYNYTHRVKPEDMLKHYEICSHKTRVEGARYYEPGTYNPIDSSVNDDNHSFSFPKNVVRTEKHFYNPSKFSQDWLETDFECEDDFGASDSENEDNLFIGDREHFPNSDLVESDDDDNYDMKPLPLPKTVSKAFTFLKKPMEKYSSDSNSTEDTKPRGFGRAKNILRLSTPTPPETNDHLLPKVSDMQVLSSEKKVSKFSSRNVISCSDSVVSSAFDDTNTLKSQDIVFDDDDDDDDDDDGGGGGDGDGGGGFILKNFDMYLKI